MFADRWSQSQSRRSQTRRFYLLVKDNDLANTVSIHVRKEVMKWYRTQPNIVHSYESSVFQCSSLKGRKRYNLSITSLQAIQPTIFKANFWVLICIVYFIDQLNCCNVKGHAYYQDINIDNLTHIHSWFQHIYI